MGRRRLVSAANWDREVIAADVPVLVAFWSRDSAPCRFEDNVLDEVDQRYRRLRVLRVDVDAEPALVERYDVRALPTMLLFLDGVPLHRLVGYHEGGELTQQLAGYLH